ncbi:ABC transporter ATP-binding protein [Paenibacillus baekrokdamisoli]|uniref:ABC transporter ATP-binding protein n=1 Tax=Paenibacillus baekrokdamisoli TaxID=1712516 RepID=A0A3G9IRS6_9BACL|nr:sugar ABC transporter ATP-binding protein [Paenibacillus baekrokdamisoli]MBB3069644.1 simple sugar transport system ATP-binding protein [Paenibacillus baekrokdamisoli]BBH21002.1 ABC transporter ATP-binding protein [Paenibacillus baekrokdamisoli]
MGTTSKLSMQNINKSFAGVPALQNVDLEVRAGEIHALLGANGAGKSTLMKVLSGAYELDSGSIEIDGKLIAIKTPGDAKAGGIHCVYQEIDTALVPQLSVTENIMLDRISSHHSSMWLQWSSLHKEAELVLARLGASIPVRKKVEELTLAEKQLVLIARLLTEQAKVVIFDEPTAPLSLEEAERLFRVMHQLKSDGIGCIFISHRLPEVFQNCDRITVMRDGQRVLTTETKDSSIDEIVRFMLGRTFEEEFPKIEAPIGATVLEVKGLTRSHVVRDVSFEVKSGEIVAIVGSVGAGKTELSRLLFGADLKEAGTVKVNGQEVKLDEPASAIRSGIALVPEERRKQGILVAESVKRNLSLPILNLISKFGFLSRSAETLNASQLINRLGIKASSASQQTMYLSGGNQQKVSIGKWLPADVDVFLFDEPTKGVDIGAKSDIFRIIGDLAGQGKAIVYLTCEFTEALGIADRILVMCDGRLVGTFPRGKATQEQLLLLASGGEEVTG